MMRTIVPPSGLNLLADATNKKPIEITVMLITRHIGSLITIMATSRLNPMKKVISASSAKSKIRLIVRSPR